MPYIDEFNSIVTLSKRNHRYYGPTESQKVSSSLSEISTDFDTLYDKINDIDEAVDAVASGYIMPSGFNSNIYDLKTEIYNLEKRVDKIIYVHGQ